MLSQVDSRDRAEIAFKPVVLVSRPIKLQIAHFTDLDHIGVGSFQIEFDGYSVSTICRKSEISQNRINHFGRTLNEGFLCDVVRRVVEHPRRTLLVEVKSHGRWRFHMDRMIVGVRHGDKALVRHEPRASGIALHLAIPTLLR